MILENGESEVLDTPADLAAAEYLANRYAMPGMKEYISPNQCRECGRNMPWTLVPLPDEELSCEICSFKCEYDWDEEKGPTIIGKLEE